MTEKQFQRLQAEWDARLRATGFQDIEAPSGCIERRETKAPTEAKLRRLAQLEQDREATPRLRFGEAWERRAWELHLEGLSNREVARRCCVYRKLVDLAIDRLRVQVRLRSRRQEDSLRSEDLQLHCLLTPKAREAFEYLRERLGRRLPISEIIRAALEELARKIPADTQGCSTELMYIAWKKPEMRRAA